MNIIRNAVPGIAIVGVTLLLAVGFDRAMRPGPVPESGVAITVEVATTPDTLAVSTAVSASTPSVAGQTRARAQAFEPWPSNSGALCGSSVCESTAGSNGTRDTHGVPRNAIVLEVSSGRLDPDLRIDAISSPSPLGTSGVLSLQSTSELS